MELEHQAGQARSALVIEGLELNTSRIIYTDTKEASHFSLYNCSLYGEAGFNAPAVSVYTILEGGEYVFYVRTTEDCLDTLRIEVPVYGIPEVIVEDQTLAFCEESVGSITAMGEGGKGIVSLSLNGEEGSSLETYEALNAGSYVITVTDESGCTATEEVVVESTPRVRVEDLNAEQLFCGDVLSAVKFTPAGGTGSLSYTLRDSAGEIVDEADGLPEGQYRLIVTDEVGCETTELIVVQKEDCQMYIPTAFDPHSNGEDRTFKLGVPEASNFIIESYQVFDRWGNLVYNQQDIDPLTFTDWWDGSFNGRDVEQGVYVYVLQLGREKPELISGTVTIIR